MWKLKNVIFFLQRIFVDDLEEIKIKGFINIEKRLTIQRERQKDQAYNKYMWRSPPNDGNDFGLRELFGLEYDAAFAPESWD
ncbi:hypothetical protein PUN28_016929 [Cardiocondyla obscurior]|uniref:Uncharacterized protein n=1 Tax=Cardiocondyla obscurior TaxID=286306 RepID=A0AAW2EJK6_9HYME